jgi:hypothetical protein
MVKTKVALVKLRRQSDGDGELAFSRLKNAQNAYKYAVKMLSVSAKRERRHQQNANTSEVENLALATV